MMDLITIAGFLLAVFISGVTVGKFSEKIERFIREHENKENKNNRR